MAKSNVPKMSLPSVDELFSTQEEREDTGREKIKELSLSDISEFPNHPFQVRMNEDMEKLVDSVKDFGVLAPVIVRPKASGGYEMVAGHRRMKASELAGLQSIPAIIRDLSDDESTILMVDSNLQREQILPSEKAFAYKMKLEAMKRQGKRVDLTSVPVAQKSGQTSRELLGKQVGESQDQIRRYIRLTELAPPILDMVDDGKIAFRPAVELSYLDKTRQEELLEAMGSEDCTPSLAQAVKMKAFAKAGSLDSNVILSILQEEKPNQVEQFKMSKDKLSKYFPTGTPVKKMEDTIIRALDMYQKRSRDRER